MALGRVAYDKAANGSELGPLVDRKAGPYDTLTSPYDIHLGTTQQLGLRLRVITMNKRHDALLGADLNSRPGSFFLSFFLPLLLLLVRLRPRFLWADWLASSPLVRPELLFLLSSFNSSMYVPVCACDRDRENIGRSPRNAHT